MTSMTSSVLERISLAGAPYAPGDPIVVEHKGQWREGWVYCIAELPTRHVRFGRRWLVRVDFAHPAMPVDCTVATVDDDGLNHTRGERARGSEAVL